MSLFTEAITVAMALLAYANIPAASQGLQAPNGTEAKKFALTVTEWGYLDTSSNMKSYGRLSLLAVTLLITACITPTSPEANDLSANDTEQAAPADIDEGECAAPLELTEAQPIDGDGDNPEAMYCWCVWDDGKGSQVSYSITCFGGLTCETCCKIQALGDNDPCTN